LSLLSVLMHKSLLYRDASGAYRVLEVMRQYAEEKLQQHPRERHETHDRHCEYYAEFIHQREGHLKGAKQQESLAEIEAEIANVRAGWQWGTTHKKRKAIGKFLQGLALFYEIRCWFLEGENAFGQAAERLREATGIMDQSEKESSVLVGEILARQGWFCELLSQFDEARELLGKSLDVFHHFDSQREMAFSLCALGVTAWKSGEYSEAERLLYEGLAIGKETGDRWVVAKCFNNLGIVAGKQEKYIKAEQMFREGLAIYRESKNQRGIARCLNNLGTVLGYAGRQAEAKQQLEESLAICRETNDLWGTKSCLMGLGMIAYGQEEYSEAEQFNQKGLTICKEINDRWGAATFLSNLGLIAEKLTRYDEAKQFHQKSLTICEEIGYQWGTMNVKNNLGFTLCALGEVSEAEAHFYEVLKTTIEARTITISAEALVGVATILTDRGKTERAAEIVACVLLHFAHNPHVKNRAEQLFSKLKSQLSPRAFAMAQERGEAREIEYYVHSYRASEPEA
jgi:tetratricopeptide (TPR) repeat protein